MVNKHRRYVKHCAWKNAIAVAMSGVTAGIWVPFAETTNSGPPDEEEEVFSVPPPVHELHRPLSWPERAVPSERVTPAARASERPPNAKPSSTKKAVSRPLHPQPKADKTLSILTSFLRAQVGKPYVWGGNGPSAYDCSGLTKAAFARIGVYLPRTSQEQSLMGTPVSLSELHTGDLVFWGTPGLAFHVGVYVGNGKYIAAQNPATGIVQYTLGYYMPHFARRVL